MPSTNSNLPTFTFARRTTVMPPKRIWHLDVPATYAIPPAGCHLTIALATHHPLAHSADAGPEIVLACAGGHPVWFAEIAQQGRQNSLPMVWVPNGGAPATSAHLTAVQIRVIDGPIQAFDLPEQAHLAKTLADLPDMTNYRGSGILGVATELDVPTASAVQTILGQAGSTSTGAKGYEPDAQLITTTVLERVPGQVGYWYATQHDQPYWALEVPHSYCPPLPRHRLTAFVMTVGDHSPIRPGDLVFAFARSRLTMVGRVKGSSTPAELKMSIEVSADPKKCRGYITTAEFEVLDIDPEEFYEEGDGFFLDQLSTYISTLFPGRADCSFGDARPFDAAMGDFIALTLDLLNDEDSQSPAQARAELHSAN